MLSPETLETWCSGIGISPHARALIDRIRTSDPARRVGGGRSNVSGRYPSRKMGVTIQFESHRVELAGIYEMEHDPERPRVLRSTHSDQVGLRSALVESIWAFSIRPTSS